MEEEPSPKTEVKLPLFNETQLVLPPFFITQTKKGWRLVNPLTKIRNLSTRGEKTSVNLTRAFVKKPIMAFQYARPLPTMADFSKEDQRKISKYLKEKTNLAEAKIIRNSNNSQRGFPPVLYKNAEKAGLTAVDDKVYASKTAIYPPKEKGEPKKRGRPRKKGAKPPPEQVVEPPQAPPPEQRVSPPHAPPQEEKEGGLGETLVSLKKKRGRPSVYKTEEEKKQMKRQQTLESNARRRQEKKTEKELKAIQEVHKKNPKKVEEVEEPPSPPSPPPQEKERLFLKKERFEIPPVSDYGNRPPYNTTTLMNMNNKDKEDLAYALLKNVAGKSDHPVIKNLSPSSSKEEFKKAIMDLAKYTGNYIPNEPEQFWLALNKVLMSIDQETRRKIRKNPSSGKGLSKNIVLNDLIEDNADGDGEESGGSLLGVPPPKRTGGSLEANVISHFKKDEKKMKKLAKALKKHKAVEDKVEGEGIGEFVSKVIHGRRTEYSPSAKKILDANENAIVQSLEIHRNPLPSIYQKALSFLSGGETDKIMASYNKDKLFHISLWVKLSNGKTIKVEKTDTVALSQNPKAPKKEESLEVKPLPSPMPTFGDFLKKTQEKMGLEKFFGYDARDNNCGHFIEAVLQANGMLGEASKSFIHQDTKTLLSKFGLLSKFVRGITETAHRANVIMEGGDIDSLKQHLEHGATPTDNPQLSGDGIVDWEDIKWGSLTAQFNRFKEEHPDSKVDSLEEFARMILENPNKYQQRTKKRARFYLNVLLKKSSPHSNIMSGGELVMEEPRHKSHLSHPALQSDLYPRLPQSFSQIYMSHPHPLSVSGMEGGKLSTKSFEKGAKKFFTHTLPSGLIHKALPAVIGATATALTDNPAVGAVAGKTLGKMAGDQIGKMAGMGMGKRPPKGSPEMKEYMRKMREKRKPRIRGGLIPSPPSRSPITDPSLI